MPFTIRNLLVYGLNGTLLAILFGLIAISAVNHWKKQQCECPVTERLERLQELKTTLKREIFGQHIANEAILIALEAHITNPNPVKALVLCLHGTVGTGKTRVSQLIEHSLFGKSSSDFVVRLFGPHDFIPDVSKLVKNQEKVKTKVVEAAKKCKQSLFVFDEVDKMKPDILNKIIHFIDHQEPVNGVDYRSSIFIFISNTGGKEISDYMEEILYEGKLREDTSLDQFKGIIEKAAYTTDGGFYQSPLITKKLVNYYIPFLPLGKRHVEQCAAQQIKQKKLQFIKPVDVSNLINFNEAGFSEDGCKSVAPQVDFLGIKLKQKYY